MTLRTARFSQRSAGRARVVHALTAEREARPGELMLEAHPRDDGVHEVRAAARTPGRRG